MEDSVNLISLLLCSFKFYFFDFGLLKGYSLRKERTQMNPFYIWVYFKRSTRQQMFNGLFLQVKIAHIAHNVCMGWVVKNSGDRLSNQTLHLQMYGFVHIGHNDERI